MNNLVIIGAGGHAKVVCDIALCCGYEKITFLDDSKNGQSVLGFPVAGKTDEFLRFKGSDFVVAIGNAQAREKITSMLEESKIVPVTLVHPKAVVAKSAKIACGTVVMPGAVINPDAAIEKGCIINTGATVDHDCKIGAYCHVSVGCHVAGTVSVGKSTWLGVGSAVSNNINICENCMIGAGCVVVKDIKKSGTYIGVPARKIKDND